MNMGRKFSLALFLAMAVFIAAPRAEAEIKVTIKNNRSHSMSFAFCWAGFDTPDDRRSGWYNVNAGETRTITLKDAVYALTAQGFGYYAKGGGGVWSGRTNDERRLVIIHPTSAFSGHPDNPISGGERVYFRYIKLTAAANRQDGSVSLTFNP
jgi:hypothetical protein